MERDRILTKLITQQLYTELLVIEWIIWATKTQPEFWLLQIQTWSDQFLGPMLLPIFSDIKSQYSDTLADIYFKNAIQAEFPNICYM